MPLQTKTIDPETFSFLLEPEVLAADSITKKELVITMSIKKDGPECLYSVFKEWELHSTHETLESAIEAYNLV